MFDKFTDKALKAVFVGDNAAKAAGCAETLPEHILLGLYYESGGIASRYLKSINFKPAIKRPKSISIMEGVQLSEACIPVFERAIHEATRLGAKGVGTEHLLLALFGEPVIAAQLSAQNLNTATVRTNLLSLMGHPT